MTMTVLDRVAAAGDAGRVSHEQERPDPEVPERARRRTFTAQYKQEVLAAYEAAPSGEKGAILRREGLYSSLITEWRRARDAGAQAGPARPPGRPDARRLTRGTRRSPGCRKRKPSWSRSWPRPASWPTCSQNCRRSWRRSPRARTPSPGRSPDRRGDRPAGAKDRHQGGVSRGRGGAGHLVPAAPDQRARAQGGAGRITSGPSRGRWPPPSGRRS